jgi:hypothetical protein
MSSEEQEVNFHRLSLTPFATRSSITSSRTGTLAITQVDWDASSRVGSSLSLARTRRLDGSSRRRLDLSSSSPTPRVSRISRLGRSSSTRTASNLSHSHDRESDVGDLESVSSLQTCE